MTEPRHVLLVDDEPDILMISRLSLQNVGGWQVSTAASGAEALEKLAASGPDLPDVVLLDMMMPGMDGLETLATIRRDFDEAGPPVVFMTAKTQRTEIESFLKAGAVGVIPKPFDPMQLATLLGSILDGDQLS